MTLMLVWHHSWTGISARGSLTCPKVVSSNRFSKDCDRALLWWLTFRTDESKGDLGKGHMQWKYEFKGWPPIIKGPAVAVTGSVVKAVFSSQIQCSSLWTSEPRHVLTLRHVLTSKQHIIRFIFIKFLNSHERAVGHSYWWSGTWESFW